VNIILQLGPCEILAPDAFRTWRATNTVKLPETALVLSGSARSDGVLPKLSIKFFEPHSACLVEVRQERKRIEIVELQPVAVDSQERSRHGHGGAFVSIHERVVLREAFPESRRFLNQVDVVSAGAPSRTRRM
jgi:hypothetical protein